MREYFESITNELFKNTSSNELLFGSNWNTAQFGQPVPRKFKT